MEPSNSVQSLVESIDDDHVLKLTEMTKKRVEHNNPTQKRQRVVSLPPSDAALAQFQPSEKTLQLSKSCKAFMESKYAQLFQSIHAGHPVNRLQRLRETLPKVHPISISSRASLDQPRSKRSKSEKYRFVDKVEESTCIWDVDRMELKAAQAAAQAATGLLKQSTLRSISEQGLDAITTSSSVSVSSIPASSIERPPYPFSISTDSFASESTNPFHTHSGDAVVPTSIPIPATNNSHTNTNINANISHVPFHDPPYTGAEIRPLSTGVSPSSTFSSIGVTHQQSGSNLTSTSSIEPRPPSIKEVAVQDEKRRPSDLLAPAQEPHEYHQHPQQSHVQHQVQQLSQQSQPPLPHPQVRAQSYQPPLLVPQQQNTSRRTSVDEIGARAYELGELNAAANFTDDEAAHAPPTVWPQGERIEDSQDESDHNATAATTNNKRSSLRRLTEKMWKRGTKTMPTIQGDPQGPGAVVPFQGKSTMSPFDKSIGKKLDPALAYLTGQAPSRLSASQPSSGRNSMEGSTRPKLNFTRVLSGTSSPVLEATRSPDLIGAGSPRVGPAGGQSRDKSGMLGSPGTSITTVSTGVGAGVGARLDKSPMLKPSKPESSPRLNPSAVNYYNNTTTTSNNNNNINNINSNINHNKTERSSPFLVPVSVFAGEELANHVIPINIDPTKAPMCFSSQLLVDMERIPKRMHPRLKERPELASIDWSSETVDLSALWGSSEPLPTYDEYVGLTSEMKATNLLPQYLEDVDVVDIRLTLGMNEDTTNMTKGYSTKARARKWDMLELRVDHELDNGEKWIKEVQAWSRSKADTIERYQRTSLGPDSAGEWFLEDGGSHSGSSGGLLVEEPEQDATMMSENKGREDEEIDQSKPDDDVVRAAKESEHKRIPHIAPLETLKARKMRREMSLTLGRDMTGGSGGGGRNSGSLRGSMSSLHAAMAYGFKSNVETTKEGVQEMKVYLLELRQRLAQLQEATGDQLREKEPIFKEIVDKFTMEWNESYFVRLKEVEDQIQVMNVKRIENPWMDMLLIMLSWVIRGLFYIVEGVTIMIIIGRHAWGKAKLGYQTVRKARIEDISEQEQEMRKNGLGVVGSGGNGTFGDEPAKTIAATAAGDGGSGNDGGEETKGHVGGLHHDHDAKSKLVGAW
ncbi:hypothetical protein BG004_008226 [Podila humilis]|nr:hypothetical protein BG004_008226 [Podila humilis]